MAKTIDRGFRLPCGAMATIQFDVLIPHGYGENLHATFQRACAKLLAAGKVSAAAVEFDASPEVLDDVVQQLEATYREEHDGQDMESPSVVRYNFTVEGATGSLNGLAMALAGFLTPKAVLPADPVALHDEQAFEKAASYPWTVNIRP